MTKNDNDLPHDEIRSAVQHLFETCDKCHSMMDSTLEYIECAEKHERAKQRTLRLTVKYGLYLAVPIFQQVELEYRLRNPETTIPSNAVGTLVEVFVGNEYDAHFDLDVDIPLKHERGWERAVAVMSFSPDLAKCIQELPVRMMSCVSPNGRWHCHEQVLGDLVTTICRSKGIDVADTDLPPLGDYRTGKLGDAVKALPQSLADCIQDLPECIEYCIRKAGPDINGYLFEKLLYDLIDALVESNHETQMGVVQKHSHWLPADQNPAFVEAQLDDDVLPCGCPVDPLEIEDARVSLIEEARVAACDDRDDVCEILEDVPNNDESDPLP